MLNSAPRTRLEVGRVRPPGTRSRRPCAPPAMILSAMIAGRDAHSPSHETGQPAGPAGSLLLVHLRAAAAQRAATALGDDHLGAARGADVDLPDLAGHSNPSSYRPSYRGVRRSRNDRTPSRRSAVVCNRT